MGFEEMVVAIIGTVMGVGLLGFVIAKVSGLVKAWIERDQNSYSDEAFNRLGKAFMEHKKMTERRLQNLEAIVADEDLGTGSGAGQLSEPHSTIEIEDEDEEDRPKEQRSGDGNLRNMLKN